MGKISYGDKAWFDTLQKLGFGYRTIRGLIAKFPENFTKY